MPHELPGGNRWMRLAGGMTTAVVFGAVGIGVLTFLGQPAFSSLLDEPVSIQASETGHESVPLQTALQRTGAEPDFITLDDFDPNAVTRGRPQPPPKKGPPSPAKKKTK